jgi:hypothetical protein
MDDFANTSHHRCVNFSLNSPAILKVLSRQQFEMQQRKIDFFIALHRAVGKAGIGLPAKSRAPALVAGWAPRISQKPCIGARLFLLENQRRPLSVFRRLAIMK